MKYSDPLLVDLRERTFNSLAEGRLTEQHLERVFQWLYSEGHAEGNAWSLRLRAGGDE